MKVASPSTEFCRRFLEDIATSSWGEKAEFVSQVVTPLGLMLRLLSYWGKTGLSRTPPRYRALFLVLLWLLPVISGWSWAGGFLWAFSLSVGGIAVNLLALLFIAIFSGVCLDAKRASYDLAGRLDSQCDKIIGQVDVQASKLDTMLGEKMWAGEKTRRLLRQLGDAEKAHAKWAFVNFLKEVTDDILKDEAQYEVLSVTPWSVRRYSRFLAENMAYANTVWWLVDPDDYFYELLPGFFVSVLAGVACAGNLAYEALLPDGLYRQVTDLFRGIPAGELAQLSSDEWVDLRAPRGLDPEEVKDRKITELKRKILPVQAKGGINILRKCREARLCFPLNDEKFQEGHAACSATSLDALLPHTSAFGKCLANKQRVIYLGTLDIAEGKGRPSRLGEAIGKKWSWEKFAAACERIAACNPSDLSVEDRRAVLGKALRLFEDSCGTRGVCRVATCIDAKPDEQFHDVGIYDRRFVVRSEKILNEKASVTEVGEARTVRWTYYPSGAETLSEARYFSSNDPNITSRSYDDFVSTVMEMV